jgi:hypothetical protein
MAMSDEILKKDEEYGATLRAMVRHENEVTNHRTTWLMVMQGILFTAASALIKEYMVPTIIVALVGILIALSLGHAIQNSFHSRQYLKGLWRKRIEERGYKIEDVLPLDGGYPGNPAISWLLPNTFIPKVIIGAWILIIGYRLFLFV